jgi:hypothetical protein
MSVLSVIKQVCPFIGLERPLELNTSTEQEHIELLETANEMAEKIVDEHDWSFLKELATLTGDGIEGSFLLPVNYRRMLKKSSLYSSSFPGKAMIHVIDSDEWLAMEQLGTTLAFPRWTIIGSKIHVRPIPAAGETITFFYIKNDFITFSDSPTGSNVFLDDSYTFLVSNLWVSERLLKLGIIWLWKDKKGQDASSPLQDFNEAMAVAMGNDRGSKVLVSGRQRTGFDAEYAYPFTLGA